MDEKCETCRFSKFNEQVEWEDEKSYTNKGTLKFFHCRRYAAKPMMQKDDEKVTVELCFVNWPIVAEDDWCGEYEPKPAPKTKQIEMPEIANSCIEAPYDTPFYEIELSTRLANVLEQNGILKVNDMRSMRKEEFLRLPNFGDVCFYELQKALIKRRIVTRISLQSSFPAEPASS